MKNLITLTVFNHSWDVKLTLLKSLLKESGIEFFIINENARTVEPLPFITPTNLAIEIKVFEENLKEAQAILKSIN